MVLRNPSSLTTSKEGLKRLNNFNKKQGINLGFNYALGDKFITMFAFRVIDCLVLKNLTHFVNNTGFTLHINP